MCELLHVHIDALHFTNLTICMLLERGQGGEEAEERGKRRGRGFCETDIACKNGESDERSENSDFL